MCVRWIFVLRVFTTNTHHPTIGHNHAKPNHILSSVASSGPTTRDAH